MPVFELEKDGQVFEVDAPSPEAAVAGFRKAMGVGQPADTTQDPAFQQTLSELGRMSSDPATMERNADIERRADERVNAGFGAGAVSVAKDESVAFSDELGGLVGAPRGLFNGRGMGEEYDRQVAAELRARERAKEQLGGAYTPIGVVAGLGMMGPAGGLGAAMGRTAAPAAAAAPIFGNGIGGQIGRGIVGGGATGAVYGAGEQGGEGRLANAVSGAKFGAVTGGALPVAVAAGTGAARLAKRAASPVTQPIKNTFTPDDQAAEALGKALQRDNIPLADFEKRVISGGAVNPDAVAADYGGANVRGVTRAAVNVPGSGREKILSELAERDAGQRDRVATATANILKNPQEAGQQFARLASQREKIASPIYRNAFKQKVPVNVNGVVDYIDSKVAPGISGMANPMADLDPDSMSATLGKLRGMFATGANQRFDLQQLHQVKMDLDGMIGKAKRAGDDVKARALLGVQNRLLQAMDKASPLYKQARGIYAGTYQMEDAIEVGQNVFKMTPDDVRAVVAKMTSSEREMVQLGVARAIRDQIDNIRDGRDVVKTIFATPKIRDALRVAFNDDAAFRKFQATLMRESKMRRTFDASRGNSTTTQQISDLLDMRSGIGTTPIALLLEGKPGQAMGAAIRQTLLGEQGLNEKVADRLAEMLLSKDPTKILNALKTLRAKEGALERMKAVLSGLTQSATISSAQNYPRLTSPQPTALPAPR